MLPAEAVHLSARVKVSSHQPSLFPWLGFWDKFLRSDLHIVSAGVRFAYGDYQNRVQFPFGWLTLPVVDGAKDLPLKDVRFHRAALPKMRRALEQTVGAKKMTFREQAMAVVDAAFACGSDSLLEFNMLGLRATAGLFDWKGEILLDLEEPDPEQSKTERLLARLSRHVSLEGCCYLAGRGTASYLDMVASGRRGMFVVVQESDLSVPPVSVLDMIASIGPDKAMVHRWFGWEAV